MQNVNFHSTDDFFDFVPENELKIIRFLRQMIFDCIPECRERLAYNVPFYYRNRGICFLWPSSVTWGNARQKAAVRFGFVKGYLLTDESGYLDRENRKQVYWKEYNHIQEIDTDLLRSFLFEAVLIDDRLKKNIRKK